MIHAPLVQGILTLAGFATSSAAGAGQRLCRAAHALARTSAFRQLADATVAATADTPPPRKPDCTMNCDVVDQASWESFPASDPPGY